MGVNMPQDKAQERGASASGFDPSRDDSVLLIADKDKPLAYLELDDVTLGRFARYHLLETNKAAGRDAVGREMPLTISLAMHAKVALAHLYTAVFGECDHIWEMRLQGLSWKGQPDGGDWLITVQRMPASLTPAPSFFKENIGLSDDECQSPAPPAASALEEARV